LAGNETLSRALIFGSVFNQYKRAVAYVKMVNGWMKGRYPLHLIHSKITIYPTEVGYFTPKYTKDASLRE